MAEVKPGTKTLSIAELTDRPRARLEMILWERADKPDGETGCWIPHVYFMANGYGTVTWAGKFGTKRLAHRVSYALANGETPGDRMVCHRCDNRRCVNPAHLFLDVAKGNTADMIAKGRMNPECNALSDETVMAIRNVYATGEYTQRWIAEKFGIPTWQANYVITGHHYGHLPVLPPPPGSRMRSTPQRPNIQGAMAPRAVLTEEQVLEARARARAGERVSAIANSMGVKQTSLYGAIHGRSWKYLHPETIVRAVARGPQSGHQH